MSTPSQNGTRVAPLTPPGNATVVGAAGPPGFRPRVGPAGFELLDEVGRGGMGVVHRALDYGLGREVAVKLLQDHFDTNSDVAARFVEEARITGQLQHPGIPAVYQVGKLPDGRPFLAMKLIRGETIEGRIGNGPPLDPLAVFEAIAQAVGYAHSQGVIHRDLKPSNVMVGAFGEVQVMDWGLAKVLASRERERPEDTAHPDAETVTGPPRVHPSRDSDGSFTEAGSAIGTPAFMPPEQATGQLEKINRRSDVFGLGGILCVLLTGRPPFEGQTAISVRENGMRGNTAAALARLDACGAAPEVVALCKRCLAFDPADRPADGDEVAKEVARIRAAADDRARRAEHDKLAAEVRRRAVQRGAAVVAAALALGVIGTTVGLIRAKAAYAEAESKRIEAETARTATAAEHGRAVAKESETASLFQFFQKELVAAAQPKGPDGGLGPDVRLRDALVASLGSIPKTFAGKPQVEARLRMALAGSFQSLGDIPESDRQAAAALRLLAGANGPDHPSELPVLRLMLDNMIVGRRFPEAVTLGERVLPRLRAGPGPDDPETLDAAEALAFAYAYTGRFKEALALREDGVARRTATAGADHPATHRARMYLAISYSQEGRHDDAVRVHRESFEKMTEKLGPDNPAVLSAANNLANGLAEAGRHDEAFKLREETVARRRKVLGDDHPSTLLSMHNLAASYAQSRRYKEAAERGEEVLKLRTAKLGRENESTLRSMGNLADAYTKLGLPEKALPLWEENLALLTKFHPPEHTDYLGAVERLARTLVRAGRGADAVAKIDASLKRVEGRKVNARKLAKVLGVRARHFAEACDGAECRATAEAWEKRKPATDDDLLTAASLRAIAAGAFTTANNAAEATAEADRAVAWLAKAVAAGIDDRADLEDADFAPLAARPDFRKLIEPLRYVAPLPRPVR